MKHNRFLSQNTYVTVPHPMEEIKYEAHESLGVVLTFYLFALFLSTLAINHDCISKKWRTVQDTRFKSKLHLFAVIISLAVTIYYISVQANGKDYKEMSAGVIGFLFASLHFCRTFLGLWELHCFEQWALSCLKSIDSLKASTFLVEENSENAHTIQYQSDDTYYKTIDNIFVNDSIIDNRLLDGDVRCGVEYVPEEMRQQLEGKKWVHKILRHILQVLKAFINIPFLIFCIVFNVDHKFKDSSNVPYLSVQKPEEVWIRWSTLLLVYCNESLIAQDDIKVPESFKERRKFLQSIILQCSLNVSNKYGNHFALPYDVWCKMEKEWNSLLSKDTIIKYTGSRGLGLPFGTPHRSENLHISSSYGYSLYSERLRRFLGELPVHKWDLAKHVKVNDLEWFLVLTSVRVWSTNGTESEKSKIRILSDIIRKQFISITNLRILWGYKRRKGNNLEDNDLTKEKHPVKRDQTYKNNQRYENFRDQLGTSNSKTEVSIVDNIPGSFIGEVMSKLFRDNETVLEVSYHLDNWISLTSGNDLLSMDRYFREKKQPNLRSLYKLRNNKREELFKGNSELEMVRNMFRSTEIQDNRSSRFVQSLKFLGCGMEEIRSTLMEHVQKIDEWDRNVEAILSKWSKFSFSKDFQKLLELQRNQSEYRNIHNTTTFKMRLLWELQKSLWDDFEKRDSNHVDDLVCLCIIYFPSLNMCKSLSAIDGSEYFFNIIPLGSPQEFYVCVKVRETDNGWFMESGLRCNVEPKEKTFKWESWKTAFFGRIHGALQWKEKCNIFRPKNDGSELHWNFPMKKNDELSTISSTCDYFRQTRLWRGWLPHRPNISKFEIKCTLPENKYRNASPDQLEIGVHSLKYSIRQIARCCSTNRTIRSVAEYLDRLKEKADNLRDEKEYRLALIMYEKAALNHGDSHSLIHAINILKQDKIKKRLRNAASLIVKYCDWNKNARSFNSSSSKTAFELLYDLVKTSNFDLEISCRFAVLCLRLNYNSNKKVQYDNYNKARYALFISIASDHDMHEQDFLQEALKTLSYFNSEDDPTYRCFAEKLHDSMND